MAEREIHRVLCWGLIAIAAITAVALTRITAPYGRHARGGWGPTMPAGWGWVMMETPGVVVFAGVYLIGDRRASLVPLLLLGLWQLHYLYRAWIFPFRLGAAKRTPVTVMALGALFNVVNAYLNARHVSHFGSYPGLADPLLWTGAILFVFGRELNRRADRRLLSQRKAQDEYVIPRGGAFRWVSCPNYLGEIVEWIGWALASFSLAGLAFALFTMANLAPRAAAHHRWYRQRFDSYPEDRKALVPLLW